MFVLLLLRGLLCSLLGGLLRRSLLRCLLSGRLLCCLLCRCFLCCFLRCQGDTSLLSFFAACRALVAGRFFRSDLTAALGTGLLRGRFQCLLQRCLLRCFLNNLLRRGLLRRGLFSRLFWRSLLR